MMIVQRKYVFGSSLTNSKLFYFVEIMWKEALIGPVNLEAAKRVDKESCFFQFSEFFSEKKGQLPTFYWVCVSCL